MNKYRNKRSQNDGQTSVFMLYYKKFLLHATRMVLYWIVV